MWSSFLVLLVASTAWALDVKFCGQYITSYIDAADSSTDCTPPGVDDVCTLDDDYFRDNDTEKPARGAKLKVENASGTLVWDDYVAWDGADVGCTSQLSLPSGTYTAQIVSRAWVSGNQLVVRANDTNNALWVSQPQNLSVTSSGTYTVTVGPHRAWNVAAAIGWAMARRAAGTANHAATFYFYTCPCPPSGGTCTDVNANGSCHRASSSQSFFDDDNAHDAYKQVITHETGHQLAEYLDGGLNPLGAGNDAGSLADPPSSTACGAACTGYQLSDVDCPDTNGAHGFETAEFQSVAIWEGLAHYYSAVIWNNSTGDDCELLPSYSIDWDENDWDGDGNDEQSTLPLSCEGSPEYNPGYTVVDAGHYDEYCTDHGPNLLNRATELDWMRFWRDLDRFHGLGTTDIFEVYDAANPRDWDWDESSGVYADFPEPRMEDAAVSLGWGPAWSSTLHGEYANGIWRP